jgi:hypothetical protein
LAGVASIAKDVDRLQEAAQHEMMLNHEATPAVVIEELQQLSLQLQASADELARINQFQRLFKVC